MDNSNNNGTPNEQTANVQNSNNNVPSQNGQPQVAYYIAYDQNGNPLQAPQNVQTPPQQNANYASQPNNGQYYNAPQQQNQSQQPYYGNNDYGQNYAPQPPKKGRKKLLKILIPIICAVILVVVGLCIFFSNPVQYSIADSAFKNKDYDKAFKIFVTLEDYKDSVLRAAECQKEKTLEQFGLKDDFEKLEGITLPSTPDNNGGNGSSTNPPSDIKTEKDTYDSANRALESGDFKNAYKAFKGLGNYGDADSKVRKVVMDWAEKALSNLSEREAKAFFETVSDYSNYQSDLYNIVMHSFNQFRENGEKDIQYDFAKAANVFLRHLPSNYDYVEDLKTFTDEIRISGNVGTRYILNNKDLIFRILNIDYVMDYMEEHDFIAVFLDGKWVDYNGNFFSFTLQPNGSSSSDYNLPVRKPAEKVKYYDMVNMEYTLFGYDRQVVGKHFKFTMYDVNIMEVYCYKDGSTYLLYRQ